MQRSPVAAHGHASYAGAANARAAYQSRHPQGCTCGCGSVDTECAFPAPPPARVYCQPAAFHRVCGNPYHLMTTAYGHSRPATTGY
jgi:hypothetical protein